MQRHAGTSPGWRLALRLVAAVPGGYVLSQAWVAAAGGLLARSGWLVRADAVALAAMLGFMLYLVYLVWAFAQHRLATLWTALVSATVLAAAVLVLLALGG